MSYAKQILGKELEELELADIEAFFQSEQEESNILEFKSFAGDRGQDDIKHKEKGILKSICAFLNSEGGLLIWGAPIGVNRGSEKTFSGALSPVLKDYTKDEFIAKISTRVIPVPLSVRFKKIAISVSGFIYIIECQESSTKPHQFENIYYVRLDGQTNIAPHYLVYALFNQYKTPRMGVFANLESFKYTHHDFRFNIELHLFNFTPSVHDTSPDIDVITSRGEINVGYPYKNQISIYKPGVTVAFQRPHSHKFMILLDRENNFPPFEFTLLINYNGSNSLSIYSEYTIKLDSYFKSSFQPLEESKLRELKMSERDTLQGLLGREPKY